MKVFVTGSSGYVGGTVAAALLAAGHRVCGLVRSDERAAQVRARGIEPALGTLADHDLLARMARVARVALNDFIRAAAVRGVRTSVIAPSMIYGRGSGVNPHSIQIPKMIAVARKFGVARYVGRGGNVWSNVHVDDLAELYLAALDRSPAGAFCYAENGENSMREIAAAISRMLGQGGATESMSIGEAVAEYGEAMTTYSFGSNSRVRAVRARRELGWSPRRPPLLDDIERGSYAEPAR